MANTYTTDWVNVSNGDVTTHNPQSLVPTNNVIRVLDAEIQWEGVDATKSTTVSASNINTGTAEATTSTTTSTDTNTNTDNYSDTRDITAYTKESGTVDLSVTIPDWDGDFNEYSLELQAFCDHQITVEYSGVSVSDTLYNNTGETFTDFNTLHESSTTDSSYNGQTRSVSIDWEIDNLNDGTTDSNVQITFELAAKAAGEVTTTTTESDTTTVAYPSVPSGYDFDYHYWREDKNGDFVESDYVYTNSVGDTRSVTSNDTDTTRSLEMKTYGEDTNYYTTSTQDPRVARDVSADTGSLTLNDGEQSAWYQLDGLDATPEEFYHDISGSNEARFRFRFDWEETFPDVLLEARISDVGSDTTYKVALADPSDSQLEYDAVRVAVGGTIYALDVAKSADSSTVDTHRFYHPTHGELRPRYFDTV